MHACTHSRTHARTHMHAHIYIYTHTHTHTHTHSHSREGERERERGMPEYMYTPTHAISLATKVTAPQQIPTMLTTEWELTAKHKTSW